MFIRCTTTRSKQSGDTYQTYRLVENDRLQGKVKQCTLLNLGRHFDVPKSQWTELSSRISQLLSVHGSSFSLELEPALEAKAQRYAAQILAFRGAATVPDSGFESVSVDNLELVRPRHVGIEHLALHALSQLKLDEKMRALGFNRHQLAAAMGTIIARMAYPASELATHQWLQQRSGLGEFAYHYLVVSRKRKRLFDENEAALVKDLPNQKVRVQRIFNEETDEVELYCHSQAREEKERAIQNQFAERFETALQSLADGLSKKGATKQYDKVLERIGRLKEKYALAAQYYDITLTKDDSSGKANYRDPQTGHACHHHFRFCHRHRKPIPATGAACRLRPDRHRRNRHAVRHIRHTALRLQCL
jgi:hypothetical protein